MKPTRCTLLQPHGLARPVITVSAALASLLASPALASPELAQKRICMGCHAVAEKRVGPAFKDVAARYAGQKDAATKLAEKIIKGGGGTWGAVPMPANPKVTPEEARQLAQWVLSTK
jgi:cytochrome c